MYKYLLLLAVMFVVKAQAVTLVVPERFIVLSVNDEEQPSNFFAQQTQLTLEKGEYILLLKYQDLFDGDDDHTTVKSKPFVVTFTITDQLPKQTVLTVESQLIDDVKQAKVFARKPTVSIVTNHGYKLTSQSQSLLRYQYQDKSENVLNEKVNNTQANACDLQASSDNSEKLKCLWLRSSKEEQEAFVYFILSQRNLNK